MMQAYQHEYKENDEVYFYIFDSYSFQKIIDPALYVASGVVKTSNKEVAICYNNKIWIASLYFTAPKTEDGLEQKINKYK